MSKFFKALEKVEQERDTNGAAEAAEPRGAAAPAGAVARAHGGHAGREPANGAGHADHDGRLEPANGPTNGVDGMAPAEASSPFAAAPAASPGYGAPVARPTRGRGFAWQMDPEPAADEPGQVDNHLVSLLEPTSFAAEQYRGVRLAIETYHHERGTRTVAVTSPGRGDGKTITAINVAGALAQAPDARVVLLEADLRHPSVARYLGMPGRRGLSAYLVGGETSLDGVLERPACTAFAVVTAGAASAMPYELLKSPRLIALLRELRERFDYVVVDAPPALPFPDVGLLRDAVDGFVLVVRANRTPREMLRDSLNVIGRQRALGLIFNDDERSSVSTFEEESEAGWRRFVPRPLGGARVAA